MKAILLQVMALTTAAVVTIVGLMYNRRRLPFKIKVRHSNAQIGSVAFLFQTEEQPQQLLTSFNVSIKLSVSLSSLRWLFLFQTDRQTTGTDTRYMVKIDSCCDNVKREVRRKMNFIYVLGFVVLRDVVRVFPVSSSSFARKTTGRNRARSHSGA